MKDLKLYSLTLGMAATNCYLAMNEKTGELLIIDPGECPEIIEENITKLGAKPVAILLTHGHYDHIGAAKALKEKYDIPICALDKEREVLGDIEKNMTDSIGAGYTLEPDKSFTDGEKIHLAGFDIRVMHTPGHTCGSTCYYLPDEDVLFSGDTLFYGSVGRTDFPTGSMMQIHSSVHEKLFALPDETDVFPGHDAATTIRYEKQYNPY